MQESRMASIDGGRCVLECKLRGKERQSGEKIEKLTRANPSRGGGWKKKRGRKGMLNPSSEKREQSFVPADSNTTWNRRC